MADITTKLNGQDVTLIDNLDGTYRIDLNTQDARNFIRLGELVEVRAEKQALVDERDSLNIQLGLSQARTASLVARKAEINTKVDDLNTVIDTLAAWVQSQGD